MVTSRSIVLVAGMALASAGAFAQNHAIPRTTLSHAALLAVPGQASNSSSPSLADTLNWLQQFLPNATGARVGGKNHTEGSKATANVEERNGCQVRLTETAILYDANGAAQQGSVTSTYEFSLGDLDSTDISVKSDNEFPADIYVNLHTRGGSPIISTNLAWEPKTSDVAVASFVDQASAQRAANAFKHAADLCASSQPF